MVRGRRDYGNGLHYRGRRAVGLVLVFTRYATRPGALCHCASALPSVRSAHPLAWVCARQCVSFCALAFRTLRAYQRDAVSLSLVRRAGLSPARSFRRVAFYRRSRLWFVIPLVPCHCTGFTCLRVVWLTPAALHLALVHSEGVDVCSDRVLKRTHAAFSKKIENLTGTLRAVRFA